MNGFAENLKNLCDERSVCILGYGREGRSTLGMIKKYCRPRTLTVCDLNAPDDIGYGDVRIITGDKYQSCLDDFDTVFKSPGVALDKDISRYSCKITSQTQVFTECFRDRIIGITGTKGKSTVSSLIYHILDRSGRNALLAGNIGIPVFDIAGKMRDDTVAVIEFSCHQLEHMTVSPHISVMLNLYEEHLDRYGTLERYAAAKSNIWLHQNKDDILVCNSGIMPEDISSEAVSVSGCDPDADIYVNNATVFFHGAPVFDIPVNDLKLHGVHNHYNIAVAYCICKMLGVSDESFRDAVCDFRPLDHRLKYVCTAGGVRYYDDSISTAAETAIEAVRSIENTGTVLIGGMDRGIDYSSLIDFLGSETVNVICMEASGKRIYDQIMRSGFSGKDRVFYTEHLEEAVKLASEITKSGESCILSPAAASYGIFSNFEERGDRFTELVNELREADGQ